MLSAPLLALTSGAPSFEPGVPEDSIGDTRDNEAAMFAKEMQQEMRIDTNQDEANQAIKCARASPPG